jgi:hypothetical protein
MDKPHYNVIIATPGHSVMAQYLGSLLQTIEVLNDKGITWAFTQKYASHVGDAREITIGGPDPQDAKDSRPFKGEVTYDKIVWIDSDIAWTPEQFLKIYNSDKDITSGMYLLANGQVVAYPQMLGPSLQIQDVKDKLEPFQVHGVGFGFVAVKQGVFEKLSRPWFQSVMIQTKDSEDGEIFEFPLLGEDISWCERAHRAGFDVWVDPTVRVTHHKMMQLTWEGPRP